jgi:hypothetical protein
MNPQPAALSLPNSLQCDNGPPAHSAPVNSMSLNRRGFVMNTVVSVASLASASVVSSAAASDSQLCAFAIKYAEIEAELMVLYDEGERLERLYNDRKPLRPKVLKWFATDPVSYMTEPSQTPGRYYLWCSETEIEEKRNIKCMKDEFVGTDDQWQVEDELGENERARFWQTVPDARAQARLDELVAALDQYRAQNELIAVELGMPKVLDQIESLTERKDQLLHSALAIPAASNVGLAAKAKMAAAAYSGSLDPHEDGINSDDRLLRSIANDAVQLGS